MNFCILKHDIDIYACISLRSSENLKIKALVIHNLILNIKAHVKSSFYNLNISFTLKYYIFYYQEETHAYYIHFETAEKTVPNL